MQFTTTIVSAILASAVTAYSYNDLNTRGLEVEDYDTALHIRAEEALDEYLEIRNVLEARGPWDTVAKKFKIDKDSREQRAEAKAEKKQTKDDRKDALNKLEGKTEKPGISQQGLNEFASGAAGQFAANAAAAARRRQGSPQLGEFQTGSRPGSQGSNKKRDLEDLLYDLYF